MRPDVTLFAPLMAYMAAMGVAQALPPRFMPVAITLRGVAALVVIGLFWRHFPPFGRPHFGIAILGGIIAAWGWVVGQYFFEHFGLGGRLPVLPGEKTLVDPRAELGARNLFWTTWWLRVFVAVAIVPVVEELFWRGFLLRALINWQHFERVPLGQFTWLSFLGTSLISTLQHPDNWGVSILCWLFFNAVFYWTRSLLCVILLHGFTNLVLYLIVLRVGDWQFW